MASQTYTITKKIAKQGNKSILVIPTFLREEIKPHSIVKVTIEVIKEAP
ncbi:MAG: hypothetical protein ABIJ21_08215 [Nanoarchaeota archaeon]